MFLLANIHVSCVDPDLRIRRTKLLFNKQSDTFITIFKSNNIHANDNSEVINSYMPFYGILIWLKCLVGMSSLAFAYFISTSTDIQLMPWKFVDSAAISIYSIF